MQAPLSSFSSRILTAYELGLIQENEYKQLQIIRKIRNEYAHNWSDIPFETGRVSDLAKNLPYFGPEDLEDGISIRGRFNFLIADLMVTLLWRARLVEKEKRTPKIWPIKNSDSSI